MTNNDLENISYSDVLDFANIEYKKLTTGKPFEAFFNSYKNIRESILCDAYPWDPRFNCHVWIMDIYNICIDVIRSYCWMSAWETHFRELFAIGTQTTDISDDVNYYSDNCVIRLYSCREKLAQMVLVYFALLDPMSSKFTNFHESLSKIEKESKCSKFVEPLGRLNNCCFKIIVKIRNLKIHRIEPQIHIFKIDNSETNSFLVPSESESTRSDLSNVFDQIIEDSSKINGVLYKYATTNNNFLYKSVKQILTVSIDEILIVTSICFDLLNSMEPFISRNR